MHCAPYARAEKASIRRWVSEGILGRLLWLGQLLLERGMDLELHVAADSGTLVLRAEDRAGLLRSVDALLCLSAPETPAIPEPGQAGTRFTLGGEL